MADIGFQEHVGEDTKQKAMTAARVSAKVGKAICCYLIRVSRENSQAKTEVLSGKMTIRELDTKAKKIDIAELPSETTGRLKRILNRTGINYAMDAVKIDDEKMIRLYFDKKDTKIVDKSFDDLLRAEMRGRGRESVIDKLNRHKDEVKRENKDRERERGKEKQQEVGGR